MQRIRYYLFSVECQLDSIHRPNSAEASSATSTVDQIFDLSNLWCTSNPAPQIITLHYDTPVYLTQLRVRATPVSISIYYHTINGSSMIYRNAAGFSVS